MLAEAKRSSMRFGLFGINMTPCDDPEVAARVAQAAEATRLNPVRNR
jgi:hypothetical protein